MAGLNKKILCFVDEYGTAGSPGFALGAVLVWARECGRADKAFTDLLASNANEIHAANLKAATIQSLLAKYAQTQASEGLVMLNKVGTCSVGKRPEIYAQAVIETVKVGVRQFARHHEIRGDAVGNVEVIIDANEQNAHPDFRRMIEAAQENDGRFRGVKRVMQIDSAASRMLQVADLVAYARAWIDRAEDNAAGLREKYRIGVL